MNLVLTVSKCTLICHQEDTGKIILIKGSTLWREFLFLSAAGFKIAVSSPCLGES